MAITPNSTIKKKKKTKSTPKPMELMFPDLFMFRSYPKPPIFFDRLALELLEWVNTNKDALTIASFLAYKKCPPRTYNDFLNHKHGEKLKAAHEYALMVLGDRREKGAIKREYSEKIVMHTMGMFNADWKKHEYEMAMLKKAEETVTKLTVLMEDYGKKDSSE